MDLQQRYATLDTTAGKGRDRAVNPTLEAIQHLPVVWPRTGAPAYTCVDQPAWLSWTAALPQLGSKSAIPVTEIHGKPRFQVT